MRRWVFFILDLKWLKDFFGGSGITWNGKFMVNNGLHWLGKRDAREEEEEEKNFHWTKSRKKRHRLKKSKKKFPDWRMMEEKVNRSKLKIMLVFFFAEKAHLKALEKGLHSTEVAFALLTQRTLVRIPGLLKPILVVLKLFCKCSERWRHEISATTKKLLSKWHSAKVVFVLHT